MMKYRYSRNRQQIYMILEGRAAEEGFGDRMLRGQSLSCLLPYHTVDENDLRQVWYEVSGKRSLKDYLDQGGRLDTELLRGILMGLVQAFGELERYLISEQAIFLAAETLYLDLHRGGGRLSLCYCPLCIPEGEGTLLSIFEYLLMVLDHEDEVLRETCYKLYEMLATGSYRMQDLLEELPTLGVKREEVEREQGPGDGDFGPTDPKEADFEATGALGAGDRATDHGSTDYEGAGRRKGLALQEDAVTRLFHHHLADSDEEIPLELLEDQSPLKRLIRRLSSCIREGALHKKKSLKYRLGQRARILIPPAKEEIPVQFDEDWTESDETVLLVPEMTRGREDKTDPRCSQGYFAYQGQGDLDSFQMQGLICHIGSGPDNQIILKCQGISRMHAVLYRRRDGVYLEDLSSLNGTICRTRGEEIWLAPHQEHRLAVGEEVSFAGERFVFR